MKYNPITILTFFLFLALDFFPQGIKIQGNEYYIHSRTSFRVFDEKKPVFKNNLSISFEFSASPKQAPGQIGYLLRVKNPKTNTTYNIFYNDQGGATVFRLNHEGHNTLIHAEIDRRVITENPWIHLNLFFDMKNDLVVLRINEQEFRHTGLDLPAEWSPDILFGKSDHVIDIPTFSLRNLRVEDDNKQFHFPLTENEGEVVHDANHKPNGHVTNPVWLINDSYYWKETHGFQSNKTAGINYNPATKEFYFFNEDSIIIYNVLKEESHIRYYKNECPISMRLGTSFIDNHNHCLYVYEVSDLPAGTTTIARLDLNNFSWTAVSSEELPTQLHHHSSYWDESTNRYTIFGGFGNVRYNNQFYTYSSAQNKWETLPVKGATINPRYFSSMGYKEEDNSIYIFGGMGNESGDQAVGRLYYYDLYQLNLTNNELKKIWEIPWTAENIVSVRSMVMAGDSFYTLCYPEHTTNSHLQLYSFSLKDGSFSITGDSIPMISEKINTNANLYYDKKLNKLFCTVQEFDADDIGSTAKIYTLSFPPVTFAQLHNVPTGNSHLYPILLIIIVVVIIPVVITGIRRNKREPIKKIKIKKEVPYEKNSPRILLPESRANAIYLFGEFTISDRNNKDITYMLSTKLQQAFFIILYYSLKNGITTQELSELLWPGRSEEKVKNSRGVTLNNLRKILGELDGIKLVYEKGHYKMVFTDECYCDFMECIRLISLPHIPTDQLIEILIRGKFLKSIDNSLLDELKQFLENRLEPELLVLMEKAYSNRDYRTVILLAEITYHIDPLHEEVFKLLIPSLNRSGQKEEAKKQYLLFTKEYKNVHDQEYGVSLQDLVG